MDDKEMESRPVSESEAYGARSYTGDDGVTWERSWPNLLAGRIPMSDLDDEELSRMQLRNTRGDFTGYQPRIVPRELAEVHARELVSRNDKVMKEVILKATQVFVDVIDNPNVEPRDRMRAAEYLHNRILGKTPDRVEVKAELKPWETLVSEVAIITGGNDDVGGDPEGAAMDA